EVNKVKSLEEAALIRTFKGHGPAPGSPKLVSVSSVAFSPDGAWLVSGGGDRTIRIWDAKTGEHQVFATLNHGVRSVLFVSATTLISAGCDGTNQIWDIPTKRE